MGSACLRFGGNSTMSATCCTLPFTSLNIIELEHAFLSCTCVPLWTKGRDVGEEGQVFCVNVVSCGSGMEWMLGLRTRKGVLLFGSSEKSSNPTPPIGFLTIRARRTQAATRNFSGCWGGCLGAADQRGPKGGLKVHVARRICEMSDPHFFPV